MAGFESFAQALVYLLVVRGECIPDVGIGIAASDLPP